MQSRLCSGGDCAGSAEAAAEAGHAQRAGDLISSAVTAAASALASAAAAAAAAAGAPASVAAAALGASDAAAHVSSSSASAQSVRPARLHHDDLGVRSVRLQQSAPLEAWSEATREQAAAAAAAAAAKRRERRVPATSLARAAGFGGLAVTLALDGLRTAAKRVVSGDGLTGGNSSGSSAQASAGASAGKQQPSLMSSVLSDQAAERIAETLCKMRGAALKVGQVLSIQDENVVPKPLLDALERVRQNADVMPRKQLDEVLRSELGDNFGRLVREFDYAPIAAASIGQVHKAVLHDGRRVAMKIQYPGVSKSIRSDLNNLRRLLTIGNLAPAGMFLNEAMVVAEEELTRECDYRIEASNQKHYRTLLAADDEFCVPGIVDELSTQFVLTSDLIKGVPIDRLASAPQELRNGIARSLLRLTLRELFEFRFMQTDPNWSNFLFDSEQHVLNLLDFGAARSFANDFVDNYLEMVHACARRDRERVIRVSHDLGFLVGAENAAMLDAHVEAGFIVGEPFGSVEPYDFKTRNITGRVAELSSVMLQNRLVPPPTDVYSLHRRLSGAFLMCVKLQATIPCADLFDEVYEQQKRKQETAL